MNHQFSPTDLEAFARRSIHAHRYPADHHTFRLHGCQSCGLVPLELTIEHHTGSRKGDFKGVILGQCPQCGSNNRVFSYTGSHRQPWRQEKPVCDCGHEHFYVGECERFEGEDGIPGFFDEGVVVGQCSTCGRNRVLVYTD